MTRGEFTEILAAARALHPTWFELEPDERLVQGGREKLERAIGARLPDDYVWFLGEYGGGDFAFASVYSGDEASDLYVVAKQDEELVGRSVAFSDDGTGNLFVFRIVAGVATDDVHIHDHETGDLRPTPDAGFLAWAARLGLRHGAT